MARVIRGGARVIRAAGRDDATRATLAAMVELSRERSRLRDEATKEIGTLALEVAARVVGEQVAIDPALLDRIVLRALTRARHDTSVRLVLHPDDRALVEARLGDRLPPEVTLVDDPAQTRGGCLVRGTLLTVDARIETALAAIARAMEIEAPA